MTIDEAIKHAEEVAKEQDKLCKRYDDASGYSRSHNETIRTTDAKKCEECAEQHRQLAEWLKELKQLREQTKWIPVGEERLPKGSDIVLLSLPPHINPNGEDCFASVICGHYIGGKDKEWGLSDGDTFGYGLVSVKKGTNPLAWMPSPKPYEPQESEDLGDYPDTIHNQFDNMTGSMNL